MTKWAYGVTTVPERANGLLSRTLHSLALAGFGEPRLFVDGAHDEIDYCHYDLPITIRDPRVHVYANWVLSAWELYLRNPEADYYAMFQDDCLAVKNLRQYIEERPYPEKGYLNLLTFQRNDQVVKSESPGWYEAFTLNRKEGSWQGGRGAVALVFSQEAMRIYLDSGYIAHRMYEHLGQDKAGTKGGLPRAYTHADGAIVTAMNLKGWREFVHAPSLVQHTGTKSTVGSPSLGGAKTFPGEEFDALNWLT